MSRVLSTEMARSSVRTMATIINGDLAEQIRRLDQEGNALSQPDVWDGALAIQFRSSWPTTSRALQSFKAELEQLRIRVEKINADIMVAGGNA
ncbi:MAG: pyrophosphorylase [Actinomycetota bacterium]|nr:pyrophosphorylase [Actinomycetota bacterium]